MIFAGHQPNFMPNLAFFSKMKQADLFVITTNIQFEERERWQVRNKILTHQGDFWLTVPTYSNQHMMAKDVRICNVEDWRKKHFMTLLYNYKQGKGREYLSFFEEIYKKPWEKLVDLNVALIDVFREILEIKTPLIVDHETYGKKQKRFILVGKKYNADTYLSGMGASLYLSQEEIDDVEKNGIRFLNHNHNLSKYPYSTIHYLLAEGREWIQDVI